jgi:hypothetical protein
MAKFTISYHFSKGGNSCSPKNPLDNVTPELDLCRLEACNENKYGKPSGNLWRENNWLWMIMKGIEE